MSSLSNLLQEHQVVIIKKLNSTHNMTSGLVFYSVHNSLWNTNLVYPSKVMLCNTVKDNTDYSWGNVHNFHKHMWVQHTSVGKK